MKGIELTRQQVASFGGTTSAVVTFWHRNGVLLPNPDERGVAGAHRKFAMSEAHIARVLAEISRFGLRIENLRGIADHLRNALAIGELLKLRSLQEGEQLWKLEHYRRCVVSVVTKFGKDPKEEAEKIAQTYKEVNPDDVLIPPKLSDDDWKLLNLWNVIQRGISGASGESTISFWVDAEPGDVWIYPHAGPEEGKGSCISVNLREVFAAR